MKKEKRILEDERQKASKYINKRMCSDSEDWAKHALIVGIDGLDIIPRPVPENIESWSVQHLTAEGWRMLRDAVRQTRHNDKIKKKSLKILPETHTQLANFAERENITLDRAIFLLLSEHDGVTQ